MFLPAFFIAGEKPERLFPTALLYRVCGRKSSDFLYKENPKTDSKFNKPPHKAAGAGEKRGCDMKKMRKAEKNQKKRLQSERKCAIIRAFGKRRTISSDG